MLTTMNTESNNTSNQSLTAEFIGEHEVECGVMTILQLLVLLAIEGYIIHKVRRMFELSTILTISMYTVCISLRAV